VILSQLPPIVKLDPFYPLCAVNVKSITQNVGLKRRFLLTKGFYCPYHGAVATFFLKTLEKKGFLLLNRVIVRTIVSAIADPDFLHGGIPFGSASTICLMSERC